MILNSQIGEHELFTLQGGGGGGSMGPVKKIFVGGIAHGTTEDDIKAHFMQFGSVSFFVCSLKFAVTIYALCFEVGYVYLLHILCAII